MDLVSLRLPEWDLLFSPWQTHRDWGNLLRLSRTIRFFFYSHPLLNKFKRNMAIFISFHHFLGKSSATTTSNRVGLEMLGIGCSMLFQLGKKGLWPYT